MGLRDELWFVELLGWVFVVWVVIGSYSWIWVY